MGHDEGARVSCLDAKGDLHGYLQGARETLVWKLDGLGEYDIRRPLTPTGTNLLGLVKHSAGTQLRYFGAVFDRPTAWRFRGRRAAPSPTRSSGPHLTKREMTLSPSTGAAGRSPTQRSPTCHSTRSDECRGGATSRSRCTMPLVHVTADTQRHAGHADIVGELIDGSAGLLKGHDNLPSGDPAWWSDYRDRVDAAARLASGN